MWIAMWRVGGSCLVELLRVAVWRLMRGFLNSQVRVGVSGTPWCWLSAGSPLSRGALDETFTAEELVAVKRAASSVAAR